MNGKLGAQGHAGAPSGAEQERPDDTRGRQPSPGVLVVLGDAGFYPPALQVVLGEVGDQFADEPEQSLMEDGMTLDTVFHALGL